MIAPSRRTLIVLSTLLGAMTVASGVLLLLEPGPTVASVRQMSLLKTDRQPDPVEILFDTSPSLSPSNWKALSICFSGSSYGSAGSLHHEHAAAGLGGLAFHFVVGNGRGTPDGQIELSDRWRQQLAGVDLAVPGQPVQRLGVVEVCLIGDFDRQSPTEAQLRELVWLVHRLQDRLSIPAEQVHVAGSASGSGSGRLFPHAWFRQQLLDFARP